MGKHIFTCADVYMIGYGCGVSQYPQFYYRYLEKYQVLPRPYLGSFESNNGENLIKEKCLLDLVGQEEKLFWNAFKKG